MNACKSEEDFQQLLRESAERPVALLKHSTACGVSAAARETFEQFCAENPGVGCWLVLVREDRPVSLHIAEQTGVTHASPQAIVFRDGQPVWNASHFSITEGALRKACE